MKLNRSNNNNNNNRSWQPLGKPVCKQLERQLTGKKFAFHLFSKDFI